VREARKSVAWSLFFIFLLYFTAPAYAAFAKLEVYTNVIGVGMDQLPQWIFSTAPSAW
jgi:cation/acetate symporter